MRINRSSLIHSTFLLVAICTTLAVSTANAQTVSTPTPQPEVAKASTEKSAPTNNPTPNAPVYTDYRGIGIGMSADEVRSKLRDLKKGEGQDFLVVSEQESAQIYYGEDGKVTAISIDYIGGTDQAPSPSVVLGMDLQPKPDGSMYQLKRYPEAGYWVSYNRTAGDKPIVTITMQKF
jgi:hypothetical protein